MKQNKKGKRNDHPHRSWEDNEKGDWRKKKMARDRERERERERATGGM